jgi:hypothetical protein
LVKKKDINYSIKQNSADFFKAVCKFSTKDRISISESKIAVNIIPKLEGNVKKGGRNLKEAMSMKLEILLVIDT